MDNNPDTQKACKEDGKLYSFFSSVVSCITENSKKTEEKEQSQFAIKAVTWVVENGAVEPEEILEDEAFFLDFLTYVMVRRISTLNVFNFLLRIPQRTRQYITPDQLVHSPRLQFCDFFLQ